MHGVKAVKYLGVADIRSISSEEWKAAGVRGQDATVWSAENGFTILGERFNKSALSYFADDPEFAVIQEESTA